jgi:tetratricopeptide (TPR) repeat protein
VRDEPNSQQARYLLGLCRVFTQDYAAAVKTLEPLWEPMSGNVMYLYVLGMAASRAGDKELDEKAILRLIEIGGDTPEFHLILGKAYLQRDEVAGALTELEKAQALNPQLPYLHFNLGVAYRHSANYEKSEAEFLKDIQLEPELVDNYVQLGYLYWLVQRNDDGVPEFRKALEKDPKSGDAWFGLARSYLRQKKHAEALQAIDKAAKLAPENQRVHFIRGQVLQGLGRKDEAQAEFEIAKKLMDKGFTEDREKMEERYVPSPELTQLPN